MPMLSPRQVKGWLERCLDRLTDLEDRWRISGITKEATAEEYYGYVKAMGDLVLFHTRYGGGPVIPYKLTRIVARLEGDITKHSTNQKMLTNAIRMAGGK